jgi:hypothetical protein
MFDKFTRRAPAAVAMLEAPPLRVLVHEDAEGVVWLA